MAVARPDSHPIRIAPSVLLAVFLTALSVLAFEVALSRAFSVLLRFHFVFLVISLATCGLGLGGLADYIWGEIRRQRYPFTHLSLRASLLAIFYPLSVYLLFATPLSAYLTSVWIVSAICLVPFFIAGALLSRVFAEFSQAGGTLYFADLCGAALGSFLVIAALQLWGATNVPFACGLAAAFAAGLMAWRRQTAEADLALPTSSAPNTCCFTLNACAKVLSAFLILLLFAAFVGNVHYRWIDLPLLPLRDDPAAKPLYQELGDPRTGAQIVYSEWNAFARTDVVRNARPDGTIDPHDDLYIYTDGEVPTNMLYFPGTVEALAARLRRFIGFLPFDWFRPRTVLLIGPGGGLDILLAAAVGTEEIVGVEVNPSIPRIMARFGDFNGHLYARQNVRIYVDEGRSFVRRSQDQYDLIYLALTKTATTASTSLALIEGYIYTREAFVDYWRHLSGRGVIALVLQEPPLLLRTMLTALEALQRQGLSRQQALECMAVVSVPAAMYPLGPYRHLLIICRQPLSPAQSARLAKEAIALGFEPGYFPHALEPVPFSWLTQHNVRTKEFIHAWNQWLFGRPLLNISPCSDDQPFVVDLTFHVPRQFIALLLGAAALAFLFSLFAMILASRRPTLALQQGRGALEAQHVSAQGNFAAANTHPEAFPHTSLSLLSSAGAALYFALLGVGFMLVEIILIQKLVLYLGYPVLSLSVILFALLLGGGLGSLLSQRWPVASASAVAAAAAAFVVLYGLLLQYGHSPLVTATLGADLRLRCLFTMLMILPLGMALGIPFPTGLRAVGARAAHFVPWMWGVNGLMSVVGSVGAMIIAKFWGFNVALWGGWMLYFLAAVVAASGWPFGTNGSSVHIAPKR